MFDLVRAAKAKLLRDAHADKSISGILPPNSGWDFETVEEGQASPGCSILPYVVNGSIFRRRIPGFGCFAGRELDDRYEFGRKRTFTNVNVTGRYKDLAAIGKYGWGCALTVAVKGFSILYIKLEQYVSFGHFAFFPHLVIEDY